MKPLNQRLLLCFILITFSITFANCQDAAPPVDNTELERPESLFGINFSRGDFVPGEELLTEISDTLKKFNFEIIKHDTRDMQIEATRKITPTREDYDKVIIWLERDFLMPENYIKVYFLFGRFLKIISSDTKIRRIELTNMEENEIVGDLKTSLISISHK